MFVPDADCKLVCPEEIVSPFDPVRSPCTDRYPVAKIFVPDTEARPDWPEILRDAPEILPEAVKFELETEAKLLCPVTVR